MPHFRVAGGKKGDKDTKKKRSAAEILKSLSKKALVFKGKKKKDK